MAIILSKNHGMVVGVNTCVKLPLEDFLNKSLNAFERANILTRFFQLVFLVTFDGACVNGSMAKILDTLTYGTEFQPWSINPVTNHKVYIFYDPSYMISLV